MPREVLGQRDISYTQAPGCRERPGRAYVQASPQELAAAQQEADRYAERGEAISSGQVRAQEARSPANTTATPFEDFARAWAVAYRALSQDAAGQGNIISYKYLGRLR